MVIKRPKLLFLLISIIIILIVLLTLIIVNRPGKTAQSLKEYKEIFDYKNEYFNSSLTRYYKSSEFDKRIDKIFNNCFPDPKACFIMTTLINKLSTLGDVFINGGFVRDLCVGTKPRDIDVQISLNSKEVVSKVFEELNIKYMVLREVNKASKYVYVKINELIECQTMRKLEIENLENDVNSLFYDYKQKVIIDLTGTGFLNNLQLKFRIIQPTFDDWLNRKWQGQGVIDNKAPIRVFKMFRRGYTLKEEPGKTLNSLKNWFREKIHFFKNTRVISPPEGNNFPILPWVLFRIRGDDLNFREPAIIKRGKYTIQLEETLLAIKKFDEVLFKEIIENLITYDPTLTKYN